MLNPVYDKREQRTPNVFAAGTLYPAAQRIPNAVRDCSIDHRCPVERPHEYLSRNSCQE